MKKRIITGVIMALILVPLIIVPACVHILEFVVVLLSIGAELELLNMYDKEKKIPVWLKVLVVLLTLGLSFSIFAYMSQMPGFEAEDSLLLRLFVTKLHLENAVTPVTSLLMIFIILMSMMVFIHDFEVKDAGKLFMSIMYVGVATGAFITLRFFGVRFVVYLALVTVSTDIFALVFGLTIGKKVFGGRHKMAPTISPKKSWEGAIGGTLVAVIIGFVFCFCYKWICSLAPGIAAGGGEPLEFFDGVFDYVSLPTAGKVFFCIILTLFLSICSQIGDLVASKLKRAYGIKDYSQIFPGHGGILDRFDSIFFASAMFLLFIVASQNMFFLSEIVDDFPTLAQGFGMRI